MGALLNQRQWNEKWVLSDPKMWRKEIILSELNVAPAPPTAALPSMATWPPDLNIKTVCSCKSNYYQLLAPFFIIYCFSHVFGNIMESAFSVNVDVQTEPQSGFFSLSQHHIFSPSPGYCGHTIPRFQRKNADCWTIQKTKVLLP